MKIINKSMDLKDLETNEAKAVIEELKELEYEFSKNGCIISSWYGECNPTSESKKLSILNRGYNYKPILDLELDFKYPNFLLWEIFWVTSNLNFQKGNKILDIGGSCSLFSFYLAKKGVKVVAIDLNQEIVDEANRIAKVMNLDYKAICMDAEEYLSKTKEKFDYITSICVFEHIELEKRKRIIRNIHKCLKKDGRIAFTFDYKNPSKFVNINNENDIKNQFLCNKKLCFLENQNFYDNNVSYLVSVFYGRPVAWRYKIHLIKLKEFPVWELFKTKKENDYTFGAIFLKVK